jgi:membrane fusion protein (multidrug efflux system)
VKTRQYIILGLVIVTVIATKFTLNKFNGVSEGKKKKKTHSEYTIQTKVMEVKNSEYPAIVNFTGRVKSIDRIELYAEVSGVLKDTKPRFKEGNSFRKGQILVRLDDTEMRLQLISKKSKFINTITKLIPDLRVDYPDDAQAWEDYLENINPKKRLLPLPIITNKKLVYFISGRNVNDAFYDIKSQEAKVAKYTIYAPFNGIVKSSKITPGTLVRVGQSLGEFISTDGYELEAAINFKDLKFIELGHKVVLRSGDLEQEWNGKIYRIGNVINESTQTINIYIKINGKEVKEGMYLKGGVEGKAIIDAFAVPRLLLLPEDKLYGVVDSVLVSLPVEVIKINSDQIIVKGLTNGTLLVTKPLARAVIGTKVEIAK